MIIIDTNVISELWKAEPSLQVRSWMDAQFIQNLYMSSITVAELRFGIAVMPVGKRKQTYLERLESKVIPAFSQRILAFDLEAPHAYAELMRVAKVNGQAIGKADGYIAASAVAHGYAVASRDTSPFRAAGLHVINPWDVD